MTADIPFYSELAKEADGPPVDLVVELKVNSPPPRDGDLGSVAK
jgi:hypothetical protein